MVATLRSVATTQAEVSTTIRRRQRGAAQRSVCGLKTHRIADERGYLVPLRLMGWR